MIVRIEVRLKKGYFDPEGEVTARALKDLTFPVNNVKVSKLYTIDLRVEKKEEAIKIAEEMCKKLLANPTKDEYSIEVLLNGEINEKI
ncbi:MAG: phosphoribosylformylglycinamidine synthase subunit PurS [Candidatus Methanomethyliaceae archaeon]|nr:phosphoribosylformylglycinamidine synthase subunit PurS [Candidatus Methanomethyliaceae archaeon]MDW7971338.1 phosphoribosylformylglycinamidine synthase subunit PurS [Nitrososphaerota archaeon]